MSTPLSLHPEDTSEKTTSPAPDTDTSPLSLHLQSTKEDAAPCCPLHAIPPKVWEEWLLQRKPWYKRHPFLFWGTLLLLVLILIPLLLFQDDTSSSGLSSEDSIAVVRISGVISDTRSLLKWIEKIEKHEPTKGVLLRVDSPGGGAAASQEIYTVLRQLNTKKPVVASMGSVAASGGLMVSMAARYIYANPSTTTGSIGVRMDIPQMQGLMNKLGLGSQTLTTGPYKDAGSSMRPLDKEERAYFEGVLKDMHEQFIDIIVEGRNLPREQVAQLANGKIYTGREAQKLKLVDALGGQHDALAYLRELTNLPASAPVKERPQKNKYLRELMENTLGIDLGQLSIAEPLPAFRLGY